MLMEEAIGPPVALTVNHPDSGAPGEAWWGDATRHSTSAFIRAIQLDASIQSALSWMPGQMAQGRLQ